MTPSKIALLAVLGVTATLSSCTCSDEPKAPAQPVQAVVAPPVEVKKEAPAQEVAADSDQVAAALLGLDKKDDGGKSIAEMEQRAREAQAAKDASKRKRRAAAADDAADDADSDDWAAADEGLSDAEFHATIERWRGVKSCVTGGKRKDDAVGAIRVSFTIAGSGEVISSRVLNDGNGDKKPIAECVQKQTKNLRFPSFAASAPLTKEAKFVF